MLWQRWLPHPGQAPQVRTATPGPGGSVTRRGRARGRQVKPGQAAAPRPPAPGRGGSGPGRRPGSLRRVRRRGRQPRSKLEEPSGPGATPCEAQGLHRARPAPAAPPDAAASAWSRPRQRPSWGCLRGAGAPGPAIGGGERPGRRHHPAPAPTVGGEVVAAGGGWPRPSPVSAWAEAAVRLLSRPHGPSPGDCRHPGVAPAWPWVGWRQMQRSLQWGGLVGEGKGSPVQGVLGCPLLAPLGHLIAHPSGDRGQPQRELSV